MILVLLLLTSCVHGQALLCNATFENGWSGMNVTYSANNSNSWTVGTDAGNGTTTSGTRAAYITDGTNYNYVNSTDKVVIWKSINASGYTNGFTLSFDWRGYGEEETDAIYVGLCFGWPGDVNNWYEVSNALDLQNTWTTDVWTFPPGTYFDNNPNIKIGIIFKCNSINIGSPAFAIDNFMFIAQQAPLGIDTLQQPTTYNEPVSKQYRYYKHTGQELKTPEGMYIRIDSNGNATQFYKH